MHITVVEFVDAVAVLLNHQELLHNQKRQSNLSSYNMGPLDLERIFEFRKNFLDSNGAYVA